MEPIVIFAAGVVLYCGWLSLRDDLRGWRRSRFARKVKEGAAVRQQLGRLRGAASGRGGGAVARWPVPLKGSA